MRPFFSRSFTSPVFCATAAALGVFLTGGCGNKSAPDGAYGEPSSSAPAVPPTSAAVSPVAPPAPPVAASPTATMPTPDSGSSTTAATPPKMNAPFAGGAAGPMMGGGDPNAPLTATPDMDKKIDGLKSGDKKSLAAAYADRGYARMTDQDAGAKVKYRKALEDFRAALQNDPGNAKAKENKEMIESIYQQMGRPVPGEEGAPPKK